MTDDDFADEESRFQSYATELIARFFVLVKVARLHQMDNRAVEPAVDRFREALEEFQRTISTTAAVQFVESAVYVNKRLVRADIGTWERARFLQEFLAKVDLAEVTFEDRVPDESLRGFVQAVRDLANDPARSAEVHARKFAGIRFRDLDARGAMGGAEGRGTDDRIRVLRVYGVVLTTVRDLLELVRDERPAPVLPVRRAFQELARLPGHTVPLQLGLLFLPHHRRELAGRLTRIGVLVSLMARKLELTVADARDAAMAACLAGVGRRADELAHAPAREVAEAGAFVSGAARLLAASAPGAAASLRIIAAAEQNDARTRRHGHPLSRIVAVADEWETATQPAPDGQGMTSAGALLRLGSEADLDPGAVHVLRATLGLFPVGTVARLSTGETAVVVDTTGDPLRLVSPLVRVVLDRAGQATTPSDLELARTDTRIVATLDPAAARVNVGAFLYGSAETGA